MSLIIIQKNTLGTNAIITIKNKDNNLYEEQKGDLTIIKSGDEVVGLNIKNYQKYFEAEEGAHTINELQVAAIEKMGYKLEAKQSMFIVGKVISKEQHPKSDKLYLLKVMADKELQIVTNAANAEVGKNVVVAKVGATLPSGLPIVFSKVMGVESEGMLCGGETLGMEKTDGVLITNQEEGTPFIL